MKLLLLPLLCLATLLGLHAAPAMALPSAESADSASLNGTWSFKYLPALQAGEDERFTQPGFDASTWKSIVVPSHWELQGFAEPRYADDLQEGLGLYRRTFRVDKAWTGRRIFLRFEGVLYGATVHVNGRQVGEWSGGFLQTSFDITDALAPAGAENILAVRVTTRPKGWDFDTMDCWSLSGIYRDVTLFSLPATHLQECNTRTTLLPDGSARLELTLTANGAGPVSGRLLAPGGQVVTDFALSLPANGRGTTSLTIAQPALWSAESPSLYRLELRLGSPAAENSHAFATRVGLREVTIEDGVLKLNGAPIKLRGVNHHEIWPEGRVSTDENTRRDLTLIRDANINFVRTSHYPPHPRLLDLCDELGLYVVDEVPFIHGRKNLTDPAYQESLYNRARATVARDRNHASVLFWSIGNENPINALGDNTGRLVKELDPTRPILFPTIGSYFAANQQQMADRGDIHVPHYPPLQRARDHAATLSRPIIFTEYSHQRGLSRTGTGVQDLWELFYQSPRIAGGAIWMFQDQGILRTAEDRARVPDGDLMVWLDEHRYYDTHGFYAMDGLVYSDRTPQEDYWLVRKVYSPIQVRGEQLPVVPGAQTLPIVIENRHDFRSLKGFTLHWTLRSNQNALQEGSTPLSAASRASETVALPVTLPADPGNAVVTLELRCTDETGRQLHERTLRLDTGLAEGARLVALEAASAKAEPELLATDDAYLVRFAGGELHLDRISGRLELRSREGKVLVSGFGPHTGRHPTINDMGKSRERLASLWQGSLLEEVADLSTTAQRVSGGVELAVGGRYPRPGKPGEAVRGAYRLLVTRNGALELSYDYTLVDGTGELLEAGFALSVPATQSQFRWLGQGPFAGYPGKDRHNEYGLHQLDREDLRLPGNRRGVELASLCTREGAGVLLAGRLMTLDLERLDGRTVLSHVGVVPGVRNQGPGGDYVDISSRLNASTLKTISGSLTLLPLAPSWPEPLSAWFGEPTRTVPLLKPFLHSYDQ